MALCYPAVKIVHELGPGFAAKAYGREVRELGVMLLVLFPVPYVDASAASALPGQWPRPPVGAAGMLSDPFVAALAPYAWVLSNPMSDQRRSGQGVASHGRARGSPNQTKK